MPLAVSIVIPAHNAAATLARTVASVQAQTHSRWEIVIVENGSTDDTLRVTTELAAQDPRIRVSRSDARGVSHARNCGLELARHDWVLFLDADDWILPRHLAALTSILAARPLLDAVHCGWRRVSPSGETLVEEIGPTDEDLFPVFARTCAFAIHACVVRRSAVLEIGGFDVTLRTCEDWDVWQRIARAGARFALHPEILAIYLARPSSASMDGHQMLRDSLKVIGRAFERDSRVPRPLPAYADGLSAELRPTARLYNLLWQAGLVLGAGQDATSLFDALPRDTLASIEADGAAATLFDALRLPSACPARACWRLHSQTLSRLQSFLAALEKHTGQQGLGRSILVQLERHTVRSAQARRPFTSGHTHAITLEVTRPFPDLSLPAPVDRLHCSVEIEGEPLGELELPVCDGLVPADILADAVAAEFAWTILGRFFARTLYPSLVTRKEASGWSVHRGPHVLARDLRGDTLPVDVLHDHVGWALFIQEAWGLSRPAGDSFYAANTLERRNDPPHLKSADAEWLPVDLLDPLPPSRSVQPRIDLILTVADVPLCRTRAIVPRRILFSDTIRAALTADAGLELCRVCVREALLQRAIPNRRTLRELLADARVLRRSRVEENGPSRPVPSETLPVPTTSRLAILPRYPSTPCGSSGSRRALLPRSVTREALCLAAAEGLPVVGQPANTATGTTILYSPDLLLRPSARRAPPSRATKPPPPTDPRYFDQLFASRRDPWDYTSDYEQTKYRQTLELLPSSKPRRALELACAEGHFTVQLAPRVRELVATDVASTAVQRTRQRCAAFKHVSYQQLDLLYDRFPPGLFDLIVCSEVLYFTETRANLELVAAKIADSLEPGGHVVLAHGNVHADDPTQPGFDWDLPFGARTIGEVFSAHPDLHLVRELSTPLYRIQLFRRRHPWLGKLVLAPPRRIAIPLPTRLPDHVARQVIWKSAPPPAVPTAPVAETTALPILMYHRIADEGPDALARYRLDPAGFEEQIAHLASAGYRSATFEEWRAAREAKRPLPGKRVMLTFDDGCLDFYTTAWPILQRYKFRAVVFLPSDEIGGACRWDARYGEPAPLMNWDQIRELRDDGVEFGSHTATHAMLTGLTLEEMAREALRSRTVLEEQIGEAVMSIAYPFGAYDRIVETVCGACGYVFGVTCDPRACQFGDRLLALPRLEITGDLPFESFVGLLAG